MEDGRERNGMDRDEVYSKAVRAGKRTYFFDVKSTRKNEQYLIITESKKRMLNDGRFIYDKHKIFVYKEDLENFADGLAEILEYMMNFNSEESPNGNIDNRPTYTPPNSNPNFTDISFEDLDK